MPGQLIHIIDKISFSHFNILLLLGLALFGGTVGGRLFQKLRIPKVVGYIMIGVLLGQSVSKVVDENVIQALKPFNYFALGLIGFMVGGELKKDVFVKYGRQLTNILLSEGITPFILVTLATGTIGSFIFESVQAAWALALLLGAIASATDPAATTSVLKEYKSRGPLTTTITGIVALDDGLALFLFAITTAIAGVLIGNVFESPLMVFIHPVYEIVGAICVGAISGSALSWVIKKCAEKERMLAFSVGAVLLVVGISLAINVSLLLAVMTLGIFVVNLAPKKSKEAFNLVEGFTPPIYVLFFVLVGAKLKFSHMTVSILLLVGAYLLFMFLGKAIGANFGARISRSPKRVAKYLPFSLFSQAGVAIGLSILAAQHFPGQIGDTLVIVVTATTFITQIVGPSCTKFAIIKSGEAGLNVTEDDIVRKTTAQDIMDEEPPIIYEGMQLSSILQIFSENDSLYYPVISKDKTIRGIITIEGIRQTFLEMDTGGLILAHDLMEPVIAQISKNATLAEVKEMLNRHDLEYLPVVDKDQRMEGFIERKKLNKFVSTKIIELQKQINTLDNN